jgi:hypothetical protein
MVGSTPASTVPARGSVSWIADFPGGRQPTTAAAADEGSVVDEPARPHRPARYADLTALIDAAGGTSPPASRAEIAAATAELVVDAGRHRQRAADFVSLADTVGIDTLAALWRDADPVSLPGALWALYLLRQWCHENGEEVTRLWRAGQPLAAADAVVAGVSDLADVEAVHAVADAVLSGAYRGDFAVALERAAALFRVVATGRRDLAAASPEPQGELERARRNDRVAAGLAAAAARWREGTLH